MYEIIRGSYIFIFQLFSAVFDHHHPAHARPPPLTFIAWSVDPVFNRVLNVDCRDENNGGYQDAWLQSSKCLASARKCYGYSKEAVLDLNAKDKDEDVEGSRVEKEKGVQRIGRSFETQP
ncbi:uncharacterized protein LOC144475175 [Augochlora pura]